MTDSVKKQNNFINLLKGVAIFLMLWGHCIQYCIPNRMDFFENTMFKVIYSFHMPLFMLISGYLFFYSCEKRALKELLQRRCHGLLQTILFGSIFIYFTTTGVSSLFKGDFSVFFNGRWISALSGLWFLWSVLSASLVLGVIYKLVKPIWLQIMLLVPGAVLVLLFPNSINNLYMYPYYIIGFYFAKYRVHINRWILNTKFLSVVAFPLMLFFFDKKHYIYTTGFYGHGYTPVQSLKIDLFRYLIGLVGSVCVICLMELLYNYVIVKKPTFFLWNGVCTMGRKSLQVYTLSVVFLSAYLPFFYSKVIMRVPRMDSFFFHNIWVYNLGFTFVLGVVYSVGIIAIIQIFERIKLSKVLFGK